MSNMTTCCLQAIYCDSELGDREHEVKMSCSWRSIPLQWYIATADGASITFKQEGTLLKLKCVSQHLFCM
jgi:hypothetical protein